MLELELKWIREVFKKEKITLLDFVKLSLVLDKLIKKGIIKTEKA